MKIVIIAYGTHGDILPYLALAEGLRNAGHEVYISSHKRFATMAIERQFVFNGIEPDPQAILESEVGQACLASGENAMEFLRQSFNIFRDKLHDVLFDTLDFCRNADAIIFCPFCAVVAQNIGETLKIPIIGAFLQPITPTATVPAILSPLPRVNLGSFYNRSTYFLAETFIWQLFRTTVNSLRMELNLPRLPFFYRFWSGTQRNQPIIYGYSPTLFPKPLDWGDWIEVCGFWEMPKTSFWQPDTRLVEFLAAGAPPVYVGFGSMSANDSKPMLDIVLSALRANGMRGILASGWGNLGNIEACNDMLGIKFCAHDWLFPQTAAVIHHGGAGTTAASLRAGTPTIVVPFFADQFFWGDRVYAIGAGPKPIFRKKLTQKNLTSAIDHAVNTPSVKTAARIASEKLNSEDGVQQAVDAFHRLIKICSA